MTRPASIILFERLFLASLVLGLINTVLLVPQMSIGAPGVSPTVMLVAAVLGGLIGGGIMLALWYFIARRGSTVAKWLAVALGAYTLFSLLYGALKGSAFVGLLGVSIIVAGVLQLVAVAMLFRADARPWFAQGRAA